MEEAKVQWKKMIYNYINTYSPFQVGELVYILESGFNNPYEIQNIEIDKFGEFQYILNSPRSHSTLPRKYNINQLSKKSLVISHNEAQ